MFNVFTLPCFVLEVPSNSFVCNSTQGRSPGEMRDLWWSVYSHISGLPDLIFHLHAISFWMMWDYIPCIWFWPWESHQILSFVPPYGHFKLELFIKKKKSLSSWVTGVCSLGNVNGFSLNWFSCGRVHKKLMKFVSTRKSWKTTELSPQMCQPNFSTLPKTWIWPIGCELYLNLVTLSKPGQVCNLIDNPV